MPPEPGITTPRFFLRRFFFMGLLLAVPAILSAQQSNPKSSKPTDPTLDAILIRLQNNLTIYRASVPDFFCDEHVVSNMSLQNQPYRHTATDSVFRLKRSVTGKSLNQFIESREIKTVDKKPAKKQGLSGPAILVGAFSNALEVVSIELSHCYDYRLLPHQHLHRHPVLVIDYALKASTVDDQTCPGPEMQSGRAFIDPQTMEVVRLEQRMPHHEIVPGVYGPWIWSIDYARAIFNDNPFWMPKAITSIATAKTSEWSFVATYSNYHKLTVTSRILPDVNYDPKQ